MVKKENVKGKTVKKEEKLQKMTKQVIIPKKPIKKTVISASIKKSKSPVKSNIKKTAVKPKKPPETVVSEIKTVKKTVPVVKGQVYPVQEELQPFPEKQVEHIDLSLPEGSVYKQTGHRRPLIVFPK